MQLKFENKFMTLGKSERITNRKTRREKEKTENKGVKISIVTWNSLEARTGHGQFSTQG